MKYDFELKLKFLNFFYLHGVMPPPTFPQIWIIWGHDSDEYVVQLIKIIHYLPLKLLTDINKFQFLNLISKFFLFFNCLIYK